MDDTTREFLGKFSEARLWEMLQASDQDIAQIANDIAATNMEQDRRKLIYLLNDYYAEHKQLISVWSGKLAERLQREKIEYEIEIGLLELCGF